MNTCTSNEMRINRREFLMRTAGASGLLALSACGLIDETEIRLGSIDDIRAEANRVFEWNGEDFFVGIDEAGKPFVLSLICTHKQCTVAWKPELNRFVCPCHKGEYDRNGQVLKGKPPRALDTHRIEERSDGWWLLNERIS